MDETVGAVSMDISETPKEDNKAEDLYKQFKVLQKQLEFLDIQEEYIKDEMKVLKNMNIEKMNTTYSFF